MNNIDIVIDSLGGQPTEGASGLTNVKPSFFALTLVATERLWPLSKRSE